MCKVRTITALALAALAEAAHPYGIESFDSVLKEPLIIVFKTCVVNLLIKMPILLIQGLFYDNRVSTSHKSMSIKKLLDYQQFQPLWKGIRTHRGKGLAAFLKAIGYIIPLMDAEYANYYTREVMLILIREFASPDEEMKKIVLKGKLILFSVSSFSFFQNVLDRI